MPQNNGKFYRVVIPKIVIAVVAALLCMLYLFIRWQPLMRPPIVSTASPAEIAVLNVRSEIQPDGTIKKTADLSVVPLGLGSLQLISPATMKLGESDVIRLTITPDSAFVGLSVVPVPTISTSEPGYIFRFSERLQIYPVMRAELKGVNFEITSDGYSEKPVTSALPVEWIWNVTPKFAGKQTLILTISIPVIIDQTHNIVSAQTLKNIPIEIYVENEVIARIREQLIENVSGIVVAIIGLFGALVGAYLTYRKVKESEAGKSTTKAKSNKK